MMIQRLAPLVALVFALSSMSVLSAQAFKEAPGELDMEGAYRTFARLCFSGQMAEAEKRATEVLDQRGFRGTRFECWVHDKLAAAYERLGDTTNAIRCYQASMQTSTTQMGSYTRAKERLQVLGGSIPAAPAAPTSAAPAPAPAPAPRANPAPAPAPTAAPPAPPARTSPSTPSPAPAPASGSGGAFRDAPGELDMEGAYRTFARLCFSGQMSEAETRATEILDQRGYRGTRFECWVHDKLAGAYERLGDTSNAARCYRSSMACSTPQMGSYTRAKERLESLGATVAR